MSEERVTLTPDDALSVLDWQDDEVHCFVNPGVGMLVGADHERASVEKLFRTTNWLELAGDQARQMKHGVVARDRIGFLFFATDEAKLAALESRLAGARAAVPTKETDRG